MSRATALRSAGCMSQPHTVQVSTSGSRSAARAASRSMSAPASSKRPQPPRWSSVTEPERCGSTFHRCSDRARRDRRCCSSSCASNVRTCCSACRRCQARKSRVIHHFSRRDIPPEPRHEDQAASVSGASCWCFSRIRASTTWLYRAVAMSLVDGFGRRPEMWPGDVDEFGRRWGSCQGTIGVIMAKGPAWIAGAQDRPLSVQEFPGSRSGLIVASRAPRLACPPRRASSGGPRTAATLGGGRTRMAGGGQPFASQAMIARAYDASCSSQKFYISGASYNHENDSCWSLVRVPDDVARAVHSAAGSGR